MAVNETAIDEGTILSAQADRQPSALKVLDLLWVLTLTFGLSFVFGLVFSGYLGSLGFDGQEIGAHFDLPEGKAQVAVLGLSALVVGPVLFLGLFAWRRGLGLADLGFQKAERRYLIQAVLGLFVVLGAGVGLEFLLDPSETARLNAANQSLIAPEGSLLLASLVLVVLLVPFAEELFFRAALYGALRRHMGALFAAFVGTACFAAVHTQYLTLGGMAAYVGIGQIFLLGSLLAWLYIRSRSLWPPLLLHSANNSVAFLAIYLI